MLNREIEGSVVVTPYHGVEQRLQEMQQIAGQVPVHFCTDRQQLGTMIADAEVVAGSLPASLLEQAPTLRWIHSWGTGVENVLHPELATQGIVVTCASGNASYPIAEQAVLLTLMLQREIVRMIQQQNSHVWNPITHPELYGKTIGVIGLGEIGLEVVRRMRAFHTHIVGMRRSTTPCPEVDELYPRERLHEMLATCDVVIMAAPLTPETERMMGEPEFKAMKPTAYFINVSRGGCIDEDALICCMRDGWIAGAGIDQPTEKPLPADSALWDLPNTIVTPANGGRTPGTHSRGVDIFVDNLKRYVAGEPLRNMVDYALGY